VRTNDYLPVDVQRKLSRAETAGTVWRVLKGILVAGVVVIMVWTVLAVRATQKTNAPKVDHTLQAANQAKTAATQAKQAAQSAHAAAVQAKAGTELLRDCILPGGKCFARNQADQADVLHQAGQLFTYVALCNDQPGVRGNYQAMNACLITQIRAHGVG
jgi:hypothetical protein